MEMQGTYLEFKKRKSSSMKRRRTSCRWCRGRRGSANGGRRAAADLDLGGHPLIREGVRGTEAGACLPPERMATRTGPGDVQ